MMEVSYGLANNIVIHLSPEELGDLRSALKWTATVILERPMSKEGLELKKRMAHHYYSLGGKDTIPIEEEPAA